MDDILASIDIGDGRSLYVGTLSRQAIMESSAQHLGTEGFFLFEVSEQSGRQGISVLAKASSFETALRLADIWQKVT